MLFALQPFMRLKNLHHVSTLTMKDLFCFVLYG